MSKKAKPKPKAAVVDENVVTRQIVATNYGKACKAIGVQVNPHVNEIFRGKEEDGDLVNASLLQASSGVNIAYLELLDCGIGEDGCRALADVLSLQKAPGLLTLNLDYNLEINDAGVNVLFDGLFNNTALKQLHLDYCDIGRNGCIKLAQLISLPACAIEVLSLNGNNIEGEGLHHFSLGLARSQRLVTLNLSDNGIRNNIEALTAFRDALIRSKALAHVDFTFNLIEPDGANVLLPALHRYVLAQY
ncbi:Leucine-rich repeat domain, L domain-like [Phytophthora cactorum]|nr:Leucine-rich repeat domain, L domain-like [Phytophthora cactorum]